MNDDLSTLTTVAQQVATDLRRWRDDAESAADWRRRAWKQMADLGWTSILVADVDGGAGAGLSELGALIGAMGAEALITPLPSHSIWSQFLLSRLAPSESKGSLTERIVANGALLVGAPFDASGVKGPASGRLQVDTDTIVANGTRGFVPWVDVAEQVVVPVRLEDDVSLWLTLIDTRGAGMQSRPISTLSTSGFFKLDLLDCTSPPGSVLPLAESPNMLQGLFARELALQCAAMHGAMRTVLRMTVEHAKVRVQFGRPVGSFQAVQHFLADNAIWGDIAATMTKEIIADLDADKGETLEEQMWLKSLYSKGLISKLLRSSIWNAHQVHGGVGIISEYSLHHFTRMAKSLEAALVPERECFELAGQILARDQVGVLSSF